MTSHFAVIVFIVMKTGWSSVVGITAPSLDDCRKAQPTIEASYRTPKTVDVQSVCLQWEPHQ